MLLDFPFQYVSDLGMSVIHQVAQKKRKLRVAFTFRVFPCTEGITLLSLYYSVICLENNVIIFRTAIGKDFHPELL
jgi:hypothetical protein